MQHSAANDTSVIAACLQRFCRVKLARLAFSSFREISEPAESWDRAILILTDEAPDAPPLRRMRAS